MFRLVVALSVLCLVSAELADEDDRVVNGRTSSISEFPYQVSIMQDGRHFCGGSIVSNSHVLTASHCMHPIVIADRIKSVTMRMGSSSRVSGGIVKRAESAVCHALYNPRTMDHDVAIITTNGEIIYNAVVKPIKLLGTALHSGASVIVSGWGQIHNNNPNLPEILQSVGMTYLSRKDCSPFHRNALYESMVCAVGPGIDSCRGDSGGPLVLANSYPPVQVGIVSWGIECALAGLPGAYADPANKNNRAFIEKHCGKSVYL